MFKIRTIILNYIIEIILFVLTVLILLFEHSYWYISLILCIFAAFGIFLKGYWGLISAEITDEKLDYISGEVDISNEHNKEILRLLKKHLIPDNKVLETFNRIIINGKELLKSEKPKRVLDDFAQLEDFLSLIEYNDDIFLEFNLIQARAYLDAELIDESIEKNKAIISSFNDDVRPYLNLVRIYFRIGDFQMYKKYYGLAKEIEDQNPVLKSFNVLYQLRLGQDVNLDPQDMWGELGSQERDSCYFIHSIVADINKNYKLRDQFMQKAIASGNLLYKAKHIKHEADDIIRKSQEGNYEVHKEALKLLEELEELKFACKDDESVRRKLSIYFAELCVLIADHLNVQQRVAKENYDNLLNNIFKSYFDSEVDVILTYMLGSAHPLSSKDSISNIMRYIDDNKNTPSKDLVFLVIMDALKFLEDLSFVESFCNKYKQDLMPLVIAFRRDDRELIKKELHKFSDKNKLKFILNIEDDSWRSELIDEFMDDLSSEEDKDVFYNLKIGILYGQKKYKEALEVIKSLATDSIDPVKCRFGYEMAKSLGFYSQEKDFLIRLVDLNAYPDSEYLFKADLAVVHYYLYEHKEALRVGMELLDNLEVFKKAVSIEGQQFVLYICLEVLDIYRKYQEAISLLGKTESIPKNFQLYMKYSEIFLKKEDIEKATEFLIKGVYSIDQINEQYISMANYQLLMIENVSGEFTKQGEIVVEDSFVRLDGVEQWFYLGNGNSLDAYHINDNFDQRFKILMGKKINDDVSWPGDDGMINPIKRKIKNICDIKGYIGFRGAEIMTKMAKAGNPYMKMIEVGKTGEQAIESLKKFMNRDDKYLDEYKNNKIPLSFYINFLGSVGNALSQIRFSKTGFIHINYNDGDILEQKKTAYDIINGSPVYIDGTSLFILFDILFYKKVLSNIPNFYVPASVVNEYKKLIEKFSSIPKKGSFQISKEGANLRGSVYTKIKAEEIKGHVLEFIEYIDAHGHVKGVSNEEKHKDNIEQKLLPSVVDACILSQKDGYNLMTEDISYAVYNSKITGKQKPNHCSVWALVRVLYEKEFLCFDEYLEIFYWLTIYRERFLPTESIDINHCLFGEQKDQSVISVDKLDKFNLKFIWSEEYGSNPESVINVASDILARVISDFSISESQLIKIFPKIFVPALASRDQKFWSEKLIAHCEQKLQLAGFNVGTKERVELLHKSISKYTKNEK